MSRVEVRSAEVHPRQLGPFLFDVPPVSELKTTLRPHPVSMTALTGARLQQQNTFAHRLTPSHPLAFDMRTTLDSHSRPVAATHPGLASTFDVEFTLSDENWCQCSGRGYVPRFVRTILTGTSHTLANEASRILLELLLDLAHLTMWLVD